jgi:hypothetical protein
MDHENLTKQLNDVGLDQKKLPRSTLRNWAREGLIPKPTPYSKPGKQGRFRDWPDETVGEAAAVWVLRHLNKDRSLPTASMVKRVKFEAEKIHEKTRNDVLFIDAIFQRCFDPKGAEGSYLKAYDLDPYIKLWIIAIEKVRHKKLVVDPAKIVFSWTRHLVRRGDNESLEFRYNGTTVEPSDLDEIIYHFGSSREVMKKFLGREPIDWEKAKSEGSVTTFGQNTDWDNVQFDVKNQRISVTDPDKKSKAILDLKGSGLTLGSRDENDNSEKKGE